MKLNCLTLFILIGVLSSCTSTLQKEIEPDNRPLVGLGTGINTATVLVQGLDSARNYYTNTLGFTMPKPENFQKGMYEGTISAAVSFADLSSIELLSVKDTSVVESRHSFITSFLKKHEGVRMYSVFTSSVDSTNNWLNLRGFKTGAERSGRITKELPKGWDWDDGGPQWRSIEFDTMNPPAFLPGFVEVVGLPYEDIQNAWKPYSWRKYYDEHPNGVVGIKSLQVVVSNLDSTRKEFKKIGFKELEATDSIVRYKIANNHELHVVAPLSTGDEYSKFLETHGQGVYAIRFEVKDFKATKEFLKKTLPAPALATDSISKQLIVFRKYAYGVQLDFIEESKEQSDLAKIYSFKDGSKLDSSSIKYASGIYIKYCSLCHGKDREGYTADHAPSLRSPQLMATTMLYGSSKNYLRHTINYGRSGTAMAPYGKTQGGPLDDEDIDLILHWLHESSGVKKPIELPTKKIKGNPALGKVLYAKHCASCHGTNGEGISAPALANPLLLATASDPFLHYTITEGRDGTPMKAFKDSLSKVEINALTAYIRSRASGWNAPEAVTVTEPLPKDYVLNRGKKIPNFKLRDGQYLPAEQLLKALKDSSRMIILDARSKAAWLQTHIPGSISVPYYEEPDKFVKNLPKDDSTYIVAYCACPHAASTQVVNTLKRFGYKHTAILDEGILVWAQRGYPVSVGRENKGKK